MEPETLIYVAAFGICAVVGVILIVRQQGRKAENLYTAKAATPLVGGGTYVAGHPSLAQPANVELTSNGTDLLFVRPGDAAPLAEIPIASVTSVDVIDKTKVTTDIRYTLTRVALLGIFALAVPKTTTHTNSSFLVALGWNNGGVAMTAYFRFDGPGAESSASRAVAFIASLRG